MSVNSIAFVATNPTGELNFRIARHLATVARKQKIYHRVSFPGEMLTGSRDGFRGEVHAAIQPK